MLKLRQVRQERGISLVDLTRLTGIGPSDISQMERGLRVAYPGWKARISRALGMPAKDLFTEVEEDDDRR